MSRAVIVLGMHRSGTSVITRGLKTLGVHLGNDLLGPSGDNPTGYWEDRGVMRLNEKIFKVLGIKWQSATLIGNPWKLPAIDEITAEAVKLMRRRFIRHPLWGFKDPRTVRLLPFWLNVFRRLNVQDSYLVALRKPVDVAKSLWERMEMPAEEAHRLTLVYSVPFLHLVASKPMVVVDYDLLMDKPREQLLRTRSALNLPDVDGQSSDTIDWFAEQFVRQGLRHSKRTTPASRGAGAGRLTAVGYELLYRLAADQMGPAGFWPMWRKYGGNVREYILGPQPKAGGGRNPLLGI